MSKFVRHHIPKNVGQADIPGRLQLRCPVVKHIAVATRTLGRKEGYTEDLVCRALGLRHDAHRKVDEKLGQQMQGLMGGLKIPGF